MTDIERETQEFWNEISKKCIELQDKFDKLSPEAKEVIMRDGDQVLDMFSWKKLTEKHIYRK